MLTDIVSTEPATGAILWRGMPADVEEELGIARAAWPDWAGRPLTVRIELVRRFANIVRARAAPLADLIARETGKPLWDAVAEVEGLVARVDYVIAAYAERTPQRRLEGSMGARNALRHKPHGVIAVITPFTQPAAIAAAHIVAALVAGNCVLLKPSERTPAVGEYLVDCFHASGIPAGAVRCVIGGPDEGRALAAHPGVDGVIFTGSARVGMALHRAFAELPHRMLMLTLGGNNPLIAWDTGDIHSQAAMVVQSAFHSAGQSCTAAHRLIVHDGRHEPLLTEVGKLIDRMIVAGPHEKPAPFMGPVIDNAAADRIQERFLGLMMKGGHPIKQLARARADSPFLSPAIIDTTNVATRPDEEMLGPVLQVIRVADFDAAIVEANNTRYGAAAGLIGGSPEMYDRFWANVRAGAVNWNRPLGTVPGNAPFGGTGLSGNHRPGGSYAADQCAYPVISSETDQPRAMIGIGLLDPDGDKANVFQSKYL